jgi:hypothetical protein
MMSLLAGETEGLGEKLIPVPSVHFQSHIVVVVIVVVVADVLVVVLRVHRARKFA